MWLLQMEGRLGNGREAGKWSPVVYKLEKRNLALLGVLCIKLLQELSLRITKPTSLVATAQLYGWNNYINEYLNVYAMSDYTFFHKSDLQHEL